MTLRTIIANDVNKFLTILEYCERRQLFPKPMAYLLNVYIFNKRTRSNCLDENQLAKLKFAIRTRKLETTLSTSKIDSS